MGTNSVISIVKDGKTVVKCVAGCSCSNEFKFADLLAITKTTDAKRVYKMATDFHFGCRDCTVIQSSDWISDEELHGDELYVGKFSDPRFNPRWDRGTANHVILIHSDNEWEIEDVNNSRQFEEE